MPWRTTSRSGLLTELDGLRAIAIVLVVLFHSGTFCKTGLLKMVGRGGWSGVDLFFVLSGFLITRILLTTRDDARYFQNFYARRALRIFPLYYFVLAFLFWVVPPMLSAWRLEWDGTWTASSGRWWFWTYLCNWYPLFHEGRLPAQSHLTHMWSLAVEEQFYLVWPLIVRLADRRTLARVSIGVLIAAPIIRGVMLGSGLDWEVVYRSTITHADGLAAGALLALFEADDRLLLHSRKIMAAGAGAILVAALGGGLAIAGVMPKAVLHVLGFSLLAFVFAAVVVASVSLPDDHLLVRMLRLRPLRHLGKVSYCVYVAHIPIALLLLELIGRPLLRRSEPVQWLFFLGMLSGSWAVAALSWRLFEQPILELKRYFAREPALGVNEAAAARHPYEGRM